MVPAAPCDVPPAPSDVQARFTELGSAWTLGCFETCSGDTYVFRLGQIVDIGSMEFHSYWNQSSKYSFDKWIVRLSYDGDFMNQATYKADGDRVAGNYGSEVIVHPGGRRGTFEIGMEGCFTALIAQSSCMSWTTVTINMI
jgi:hypothetical protein